MARFRDSGERVVETVQEKKHLELTQVFYLALSANDPYCSGEVATVRRAMAEADMFIANYFFNTESDNG